ncbi:exodeoxyribonuclease VII small subunit [Cyanobium sp. Cruz-8D1]|nr:exodeoxyribonuclease VII small subunit [Cyanobium sp. Cruz-8H5]MCP9867723.1 exodeoxyribonuclease VII small subunit [Cyanobium sp. Cruz-8D1]
MARTTPKSVSPPQDPSGATSKPPLASHGAEDLSFRESQTALELCLAQLQDQELDVEAMADLYRRALAYAERCASVLAQVEQQVMQWDPNQPEHPPTPYSP